MDPRWIWPFELLDKLGEGGMGVVYRARYIGNDRQVAVKLIPEDITANPTLLARFERELDVLTHLKHPNIVHCFGGSCKTKQRFYAMEFVTGGTLAQRLSERGPLPWETAVDFAIQMCDALEYAHDHGVIHRDVKPGNFLITATGQLKLSDFGLATVVSEGRLTAAGRTVGTILYMSPEQIRGGQITHSADLYGLGCVIYEMLAGHPPFSGENAAEVLRKHLKEPPPHVIRTVPDCPLELDTLIYELLSKAPEQRPATAAAAAQRLNGLLLPSRGKNAAESEVFASLTTRTISKTAAIHPQNHRTPTESDNDFSATPFPKRRAYFIPWIIAAVAFLMCLRSWFGWSHSASQLVRAEQSLVELLETADAQTKAHAAKALGKFDSLSPSTIEKLSRAAMLPLLDVRLASLATLRQHASEAQSALGHLEKIQNIDDDPMVRAEVTRTMDAIQRMNSIFSPRSIIFWCGVLIAAGAFGFCTRWLIFQSR